MIKSHKLICIQHRQSIAVNSVELYGTLKNIYCLLLENVNVSVTIDLFLSSSLNVIALKRNNVFGNYMSDIYVLPVKVVLHTSLQLTNGISRIF